VMLTVLIDEADVAMAGKSNSSGRMNLSIALHGSSGEFWVPFGVLALLASSKRPARDTAFSGDTRNQNTAQSDRSRGA